MKSITRNLSRKIRSIFGRLPPGAVTLDDLRVGDFVQVATWWSHKKEYSAYSNEGTVLEINRGRGSVKVKKKFHVCTRNGVEDGRWPINSVETFFEDDDDTFKILGREYDPAQQPYTRKDI